MSLLSKGLSRVFSNITIQKHQFFGAQGFPGGSVGKESAYNVGDLGSIPGLGRSPREGNGYPLQCSCLEFLGQRSLAGYNPRESQSQTRLNDFHFTSTLIICIHQKFHEL